MRDFVIKWGLPTVAFLLPWQTRWIFYETLLGGQPFDFGVLSLYAIELLLLLVIVLSGGPRWSPEARRPAQLALFVLLAGLFSVTAAINQPLALVALMHLAFAVIFFLALLDQRVEIRRVIIGFCAGLVIPCLLGLWQIVTSGSGASTLLGLATRDAARLGEAVFMIGGERVLRAYGSFGHPNIFGGYLAVGILGLLSLAKHYPKRLFIIVGLILFATTLIATGSRSAILGLVFGLIIWFTRAKNLRLPKKYLPTFIVSGIVIIVLAWPFVASRLDFSSTVESRSISERVAQYQDFPSIVSGHWLTGQGIGNYTLATREAFPDRQWFEYQPIHNVWLLIVGEIGLLGLFCFVLWMASIVYLSEKSFFGVLFIISLLDHYLWSLWSGLVLLALVAGLTFRLGEKVE